jgi:nucleotide-binding universal stress UspA family protein
MEKGRRGNDPSSDQNRAQTGFRNCDRDGRFVFARLIIHFRRVGWCGRSSLAFCLAQSGFKSRPDKQGMTLSAGTSFALSYFGTEQMEPIGERLIRIVHPSDFSEASETAFAHALKIAVHSQAELELVHVEPHRLGNETDVYWAEFPAVRATLSRWKLLSSNPRPEEIAGTGVRVKKVLNAEKDPLDALLEYCTNHPPDLLVLATDQREGLSRWLHKAVAEPLARRSRAMTLFIPQHGQGFVSRVDGTVTLRRILVPVDHSPSGQAALEEAYFLAAGLDRRGVVFKLLHVGTDRGMPTLYLPHHRWPSLSARTSSWISRGSALEPKSFLSTKDPMSGAPGRDFPAADPATTGQVMKFIVVPLASSDSSTPPQQLVLPTFEPLGAAVRTRKVSLNEENSEVLEDVGPTEALLGIVDANGNPVHLDWDDPVTENPQLNTIETWELHNFTPDAHPIHLHEVQFQVVDRQTFDRRPVRSPKAWESGFKDIVIAYPGEITRIKALFDLPGRYVWHCHIVEHEDNSMMRPYDVG